MSPPPGDLACRNDTVMKNAVGNIRDGSEQAIGRVLRFFFGDPGKRHGICRVPGLREHAGPPAQKRGRTGIYLNLTKALR